MNKILLAAMLCISLLMSTSIAFTSASVQNETIELNLNNTVNLRGSINPTSVSKTILELIKLDGVRGSRDYPLYLVINSGGAILSLV